MNGAASVTNLVIAGVFCSLIKLRGTIHVPPTALIAGTARYSARLEVDMPPVGTKPKSGKGAASALIAGAPPELAAGKSFTAWSPSSRGACTSVAVTAPGSASTPRAWQGSTTARRHLGPH